jgi:hypothetical protein
MFDVPILILSTLRMVPICKPLGVMTEESDAKHLSHIFKDIIADTMAG